MFWGAGAAVGREYLVSKTECIHDRIRTHAACEWAQARNWNKCRDQLFLTNKRRNKSALQREDPLASEDRI